MFALTEGSNWKANVTGHNCKKKGQIAQKCPNKNKAQGDEQIHAKVQEEDLNEGDNIFVQMEERGIVNKNYIPLNNQSTVDQIANPKLLKNIRKVNRPITVHCNAGSTTTDLKEELGSMMVKHNLHSTANVLLLHSIKQRHQVTSTAETMAEFFRSTLQVEWWNSNQVHAVYITYMSPMKIAKWSRCW
jgi:hypothetical protein